MRCIPDELINAAIYVVAFNWPYYHESLLVEVLGNEVINTDNPSDLVSALDKIRFKKEQAFAKTLGLGEETDTFIHILNSPKNLLSPEQEQTKKEIKFLFNVAATIVHG
jgi:hypothetical protein